MRILAPLVGPRVFPRTEDQPVRPFDEALPELGDDWRAACRSEEAPDMYTSRNARLYSENFHSPRKPSVPMLNDRTGGTLLAVVNSDAEWRMVPSPPKVTIKSTLS